MKHRIKTVCASGLIVVAMVGVAAAGQLDDGVAAYERGDYATAARLWLSMADNGNTDAQIRLGDMYDKGQGVPQNYVLAVKWYRKAADQGDAKAQFKLGSMYELGWHVPENDPKAAFWFQKAADQGDAEAQFHLGNLYSLGVGVSQDYVQAHRWYSLIVSGSASTVLLRLIADKNREEVASKLTPTQIAEAQRMAREWKPTK
jgi:TPR repeat protein